MKPLFPPEPIQLCTAEVASTVMNVFAVLAVTPVATALPIAGTEETPLTVSSLHEVEADTVSILIVPALLTWSRNSVSLALWTWLAVVPTGSAVRSN
jgi:hypothetical protein